PPRSSRPGGRGRSGRARGAVLGGLPLQVLEARELLDEGELAASGRPVALLADDDLRDAAVLVRRLVLLLAVDEHHDVRVLLDRSRLAKIRQLGAAVGARF